MAKYKVFLNPISSDHDSDSVVEVEAESVEFHAEDGDYNFYPTLDEEGEPVFVIPATQVRYIQRVENDEPCDDVCLDCRFKEFLESKEFFSEVWDIIDSWHEPEFPEPETIYKASTPSFPDWTYGFWYTDDCGDKLHVAFGKNITGAERGLIKHKNGFRSWVTNPLSKTTPVPETIQ